MWALHGAEHNGTERRGRAFLHGLGPHAVLASAAPEILGLPVFSAPAYEGLSRRS